MQGTASFSSFCRSMLTEQEKVYSRASCVFDFPVKVLATNAGLEMIDCAFL
jgi:hypothetical protein